ncbi:MAG: hypothetical protein RL154_1191 [Pseudomonadota bacterium]|jgi:F-type H+-transporting ATPase subunit gamma
MANLKNIQRKIKSVQNTGKITKAMKLVSTAKQKKAVDLAKASEMYAAKLQDVLARIAAVVKKYELSGENINSRYFSKEKPKNVEILFVTADKGLCGGFNAQTLKQTRNVYKELVSEGKNVRLRAVGRKGVDFMRFNRISVVESVVGLSSAPTYQKAAEVIGKAFDDFTNGTIDNIVLIYNGYKNMITQEMRVVNLLPVSDDILQGTVEPSSSLTTEPDHPGEILDALVRKYVEFNFYYALVDSLAAEHSARMQAMDAANKNAKQMVSDLTLKYNKARQEAITTELIEIISGMEALN